MASQVVGSPCHLLRTPYEILKLILGELNQHDQIGISKTCVTLWELAYPLAYNHITIEISPTRKDSTWKHLASGVGLRYVRHLTIRSLYEENEKPREIEDLVAGTIIAALHSSQLRSFSLMVPISTKTAISIKHVVILMKTQPSLKQLDLPGINGSHQFLTRNGAQTDTKAYSLHDITLILPSTNPFCDYLSQIARKCSDLQHFHLQSCALVDEYPHQILNTIILNSPKCSLSSMATRLTLRGYDFMNYARIQEKSLSFPNLKALALIDCQREQFLYGKMEPKVTLNLIALMIRSTHHINTSHFNAFIQPMKYLRELIIHGSTAYFDNFSGSIEQMQNLELLSLNNPTSVAVFFENSRKEALLKIPPTVRHLSLGIGCIGVRLPDKVYFEGLYDMMDIFTSFTHLKSFHLPCLLHVVRGISKLTAQDIKQIDHGAFFEPLIGRAAFNRLGVTAATSSDSSVLEIISITTCCTFWPEDISKNDIHLASGISQSPKKILSLKPELKALPAIELKEEMMQRYSKDGYHFMEDYLDSMMESSWSKLIS